MIIFYFIISLLASIIGAISGIGGGIIIKPVFDATQMMSVSTVSFLSGCTVLAMTAISLIRNDNKKISLNLRMSSMLGIGAAVGGYIGNSLFDLSLRILNNEDAVGLVQTIVLLLIIVAIAYYFHNKKSIKSKKIDSLVVSLGTGLVLGIVSAFLGIGGGPLNITLLHYFFSMQAKVAALNSLYIIFISQLTSLISAISSGNIPVFDPMTLVVMVVGGVLGAVIGGNLNKMMSNEHVEKLFLYLLAAMALINIYNIVRFIQGLV